MASVLDDIISVEIVGFSQQPRNLKSGIKVGGKSFPEYIAKRVIKDGLGFQPGTYLKDGETDCKTYIKAVVPVEAYEFLVYCHELGHVKSKQYPRVARASFLGNTVCRNTLQNEFNAWKWGLSYYRRLGFELCSEGKKLIKETFGSYLNLGDRVDSEFFKDQMQKLCGVECDLTTHGNLRKYTGTFVLDSRPLFSWDESSKWEPKPEIPGPKGWKPWHDLKQQQFKKSWRNQR